MKHRAKEKMAIVHLHQTCPLEMEPKPSSEFGGFEKAVVYVVLEVVKTGEDVGCCLPTILVPCVF